MIMECREYEIPTQEMERVAMELAFPGQNKDHMTIAEEPNARLWGDTETFHVVNLQNSRVVKAAAVACRVLREAGVNAQACGFVSGMDPVNMVYRVRHVLVPVNDGAEEDEDDER